MQLTHFNTMPKDCGPLETNIHNLASRAPENHRQYLPKITSHDNNLVPKKHVLKGMVNNTHNMLERAVHNLKHMLMGHGCLIPHNEACSPNQGRLWTVQGNIANGRATKACYGNFETWVSCAAALQKQGCNARSCHRQRYVTSRAHPAE